MSKFSRHPNTKRRNSAPSIHYGKNTLAAQVLRLKHLAEHRPELSLAERLQRAAR